MEHAEHRHAIIEACHALERAGLNRGASGNVSMRVGETMLIIPSAVPYDRLLPEQIAVMEIGADGDWTGPNRPSSEWRFHRDLYRGRSDIAAIVHTHSPFATVLADARKPIPAIHYMIAAFGGSDIPVADYARFGSPELSAAVAAAMTERFGCLMANHGALTSAGNLDHALWLAVELEALAHQYVHLLPIGGGVPLGEADLADALAAFERYRKGEAV